MWEDKTRNRSAGCLCLRREKEREGATRKRARENYPTAPSYPTARGITSRHTTPQWLCLLTPTTNGRVQPLRLCLVAWVPKVGVVTRYPIYLSPRCSNAGDEVPADTSPLSCRESSEVRAKAGGGGQPNERAADSNPLVSGTVWKRECASPELGDIRLDRLPAISQTLSDHAGSRFSPF